MDPFDELAALFLTEPDVPGQREAAARRELTTELVVVGHLPVRAGLWLTPYVDAIARQNGPAALIRIDGAAATVEILRASEAGLPIQQPADLRQAVSCVAGQIAVCAIRCSEPASASEIVRSGADRITLLSSADEAAVVAAYGIVKDLVEAAEKAGIAIPRLGLAVIGSSEHQASRMVDRLNRTTATFLGVRIPLIACLSRMDAAVRTTRYWQFSGTQAVVPADLVSNLRDSHASAVRDHVHLDATHMQRPVRELPVNVSKSTPAVPPTLRREPPVIHVEVPRRREPAERPVSDVRDQSGILGSNSARSELGGSAGAAHRRDPASSFRPHEEVHDSDDRSDFASFAAFGVAAAAPGVRTVKMPPKPAHQLETKRASTAVEPDQHGHPVSLASHVGGLTSLDQIRCPGRERVEIALDEHGGLHLLAREPFMRDLWAVEAWFRAHLDLLRLACSHHAIDMGRKVQMHLFTDRPASVADLQASSLRLYVLAPVQVGQQLAWYCAPLK
jgi:hypothetical protein